MLIVIFAVLFWCLMNGKQSIKDRDLEFYSQATWEGLLLVPALDTMFSLCLVHHLISCKQECILEKEKEEGVTSSSCYSSLVPRSTKNLGAEVFMNLAQCKQLLLICSFSKQML